ncbi:Uracil DNA glycosylase superfamily protein [Candidatus Trichorickettsia mobilis]|uniref:Type-4 uracil-DNA glycosylase n=1 Tax=Candidatus Trichorickettsia mobilis TaxID=1346319 RepID=A0ABZ0UU86_9RICK|nr:uracil-DNA glycosylase family protein [Candidatus Trichorickettsia mobilis]WPY01213.1 Uracil DNA glycosylase superfamily protein [Candidatus Trichorickettsia mobilis]
MSSKKTEALKQKIQHLHWLKSIGIDYYCSETAIIYDHSSTKKLDNDHNNVVLESLPQHAETTENNCKSAEQAARHIANSVTTLEELKQSVLNFEGCTLKGFATNTVFADGNPNSQIMFIGEAPGATEDQKGIPFCGESGKLLDNMLACIGIFRTTNAYITNTIFWRPPANREPTPEEISICKPFVEKHIALINPKLIVLVGSTAATSLLGKHAGISKIRQEYYSYTNQYLQKPIATTAIFHPAYLLRQPMQKKTTWYDLIKIQQFITENIK